MSLLNVSKISPVMTEGTATVKEAARLMLKHKVSTIIITDSRRKPIGIFTQHDLMHKVVCADLDPQITLFNQVMSAPVHTIFDKGKL